MEMDAEGFATSDVLFRCVKVNELLPQFGESRLPLKLASFPREVAEHLNSVKHCKSQRLLVAQNALRVESSGNEFILKVSYSSSDTFTTAANLFRGEEVWTKEISLLESATVDTKIYISASDFTRPGNEWILNMLDKQDEFYFYWVVLDVNRLRATNPSRRVCDKASIRFCYEVPTTLNAPADGRINRMSYAVPYSYRVIENDSDAANFPVLINGESHYIAWDVAGAIQHAARLHSVELTFRAPPLPVDIAVAKALVLRSLQASTLSKSTARLTDFAAVACLPGILYECAVELEWEWETVIYQWLTKASDCNYKFSVWFELTVNPVSYALYLLQSSMPLEDELVMNRVLEIVNNLPKDGSQT